MIPMAPGFFRPQLSADFSENFDGAAPSITVYTNGGGGTYFIVNTFSGDTKELQVSPLSNGYPTTCRLNDISIGADFDAQWLQSQCSDNTQAANEVYSGFVARTTNWQNPGGLQSFHWGMCVYLHRNGNIVLGYSTNSASTGGITTIASAASGLGAYPQGGNAATPIRNMALIRWLAQGQSHKVWVNNVLKIDVTSAIYETNVGYVAFFTSPHTWTGLGSGAAGASQGYPALFDNLTITNL